MRRILTAALALLLTVATTCASAQTLKSRPLTTSAFKTVLFLSQTVDLAGASVSEGSVAPLTVSAGGFAADRSVTKVSGAQIATMPVMGLPNPATSAQALATASEWMNVYGPSFINSVGNYLGKQGLSNGFFSFTQEFNLAVVDAATGAQSARKKAITWTANIDSSSRPIYGEPKITDPDPVYIHAVLTPGSTIEGLPADWASIYQSPGTLRYVVLNKNFTQIGAWQSIPVGTAFDQDDGGSNKLACLMDGRYGGCASPIDMQTLMSQYGASTAFVDYIRQIQPVYVSDGGGGQIAKGAISYDSRLVTCSKVVNSGFYGYALQFQAERYLATQTTSLVTWQALQQFAGRGISPTTAFSKELPLGAIPNADQYLIRPEAGNDALINRWDGAEMSNVVYVADLRSQGGQAPTMTPVSLPNGMQAPLISDTSLTKVYQIGHICDNCMGDALWDETAVFQLDDPQSANEFAMISQRVDDWLELYVNGYRIFAGPYGGDMLDVSREYAPIIGPEDDQSPYNWCLPQYAGGGDSDVYVYGYQCGNKCPRDLVQTLSVPRPNWTGAYVWPWGGTTGCGLWNNGWNFDFEQYTDLRPFLHPGQNTIRFRFVVGNGGEAWLKIRTQGCAAGSMAPEGAAPAVPSSGGSSGVSNSLAGAASQ